MTQFLKWGGGKYTLIIGASHTQGKEVSNGSRYSDILNVLMGGSADNIKVYNVSQDAFYLPDIVKHFSAIVSEFPKAEAIVIEISSTDFSPEDLIDALEQVKYDESQNGEQLADSLPIAAQLKVNVKENFPALFMLNKQIKVLFEENDTEENENKSELGAYTEALNDVCAMLAQIYDGKIVIMCHPKTEISADGKLNMITSETDTVFAQICADNGIEFVDMTDLFLTAYEDDYSVPYGFYNTSMGSGHLNSTGHKLIAEKLYEVLTGGAAE